MTTIIGIPPDISYGLQCSVECFDITEDVMTFFYRFNEKVNLAEIFDNQDGQVQPHNISESLRASARRNYYGPYNNWFWTEATEDERAWCLSIAAERGRQSAEMIDFLLAQYVSDCLAQGLDPKLRKHQNNWLNHNRPYAHGAKIMQQVAHKISATNVDDIVDAIMRPENFSLRLRQPELTMWEIEGSDDPIVRRIKVSVIEQRRKKKLQRKVISKSSAFLSRILSKQQTTMFLGGQKIEVEGNKFVFSVKKNNIFSDSHGALTIEVLEKKSRDRLFNLCWYVDKTPAIDQLSAMIMAVQCGDEDEIIQVGNALRVSYDAVAQHEFIQSIKKIEKAEYGNATFAFGIQINDEDTNIQDDRISRNTLGTHALIRNNADLYFDFSERCSKGMMAGFDNPLRRVFEPHTPDRIRPIEGNRVLREMVNPQIGDRDNILALCSSI